MPVRIPSYRLHKASNQAVVVLGGRSHYLGRWNSPESRAEYDRLVAEFLNRRRKAAGDAGRPGPDDLTVSELILAFLEHARDHYRAPDGSPSRHVDNLKHALRPVRALYGTALARDFGPLALRAVRDRMVGDGVCRRTVNDRVNRVRSCFRWAASVELLPVTVVRALQTVEPLDRGRGGARESPGVKPVDPGDVEAALPRLPAPVAAMARLQLLSACRAGEVVQIRGADLDTSGEVWAFRPRHHKNAWRGRDRVVYLGPRAQEVLRPFLKADPGAYLFSPREWVEALRARRAAARKTRRTPSELSRPRRPRPERAPGDRYTAGSYRQAIARACRKAGVPVWTPLQIRHAAATAIRRRFGLEAAQVVLGHERADVTQLYAERDQARAREVAGLIG
jgi:integrase